MKRIIQIIDKITYPGHFIAFLKVDRTFRCVNAANLHGRINVLVVKGGKWFVRRRWILLETH